MADYETDVCKKRLTFMKAVLDESDAAGDALGSLIASYTDAMETASCTAKGKGRGKGKRGDYSSPPMADYQKMVTLKSCFDDIEDLSFLREGRPAWSHDNVPATCSRPE